MTNDKGAEYEKRAREIYDAAVDPAFSRLASVKMINSFLVETHEAGRQEAIEDLKPSDGDVENEANKYMGESFKAGFRAGIGWMRAKLTAEVEKDGE
jgi:hypothetical protein